MFKLQLHPITNDTIVIAHIIIVVVVGGGGGGDGIIIIIDWPSLYLVLSTSQPTQKVIPGSLNRFVSVWDIGAALSLFDRLFGQSIITLNILLNKRCKDHSKSAVLLMKDGAASDPSLGKLLGLVLLTVQMCNYKIFSISYLVQA